MNGPDSFNEDSMTDIENRAVIDIAAAWNVPEKQVEEIMRYYTEKMEEFERFLDERYPGDSMNNQPYVVMEINNRVIREIAEKHRMDSEVTRMIIQDYTDTVRDGIEREMRGEPDRE